LALTCAPLLRYADFKAGYESNEKGQVDALRKQDRALLSEVEQNDAEIKGAIRKR
jgi:hypothetical protein